jgi:hypothetical protein
MRIIVGLAAVIVIAVQAGCSTTGTTYPAPIGKAPPTQTLFNSVGCAPNCTVKIDVTGDCKFSVPDLVVLSGIRGAKHAVVWQIMSADYVFSTAPATPALDPKGSGGFFGTPVVLGPIMAVQVTVATPHLSHFYGLNMVSRNGTVCPEVDPFMIE